MNNDIEMAKMVSRLVREAEVKQIRRDADIVASTQQRFSSLDALADARTTILNQLKPGE